MWTVFTCAVFLTAVVFKPISSEEAGSGTDGNFAANHAERRSISPYRSVADSIKLNSTSSLRVNKELNEVVPSVLTAKELEFFDETLLKEKYRQKLKKLQYAAAKKQPAMAAATALPSAPVAKSVVPVSEAISSLKLRQDTNKQSAVDMPNIDPVQQISTTSGNQASGKQNETAGTKDAEEGNGTRGPRWSVKTSDDTEFRRDSRSHNAKHKKKHRPDCLPGVGGGVGPRPRPPRPPHRDCIVRPPRPPKDCLPGKGPRPTRYPHVKPGGAGPAPNGCIPLKPGRPGRRPGGRPGRRPGGRPGGRPGKGRPGKGRPGKGRPGKGRPGKGRPGKGRPGKGGPGKGYPGRGRPGTHSQHGGKIPLGADCPPRKVKPTRRPKRPDCPPGTGSRSGGSARSGGYEEGSARSAGYGKARSAGYGNARSAGYGNARSAGYGKARSAGYGNARSAGYGNARSAGYENARAGYERMSGRSDAGKFDGKREAGYIQLGASSENSAALLLAADYLPPVEASGRVTRSILHAPRDSEMDQLYHGINLSDHTSYKRLQRSIEKQSKESQKRSVGKEENECKKDQNGHPLFKIPDGQNNNSTLDKGAEGNGEEIGPDEPISAQSYRQVCQVDKNEERKRKCEYFKVRPYEPPPPVSLRAESILITENLLEPEVNLDEKNYMDTIQTVEIQNRMLAIETIKNAVWEPQYTLDDMEPKNGFHLLNTTKRIFGKICPPQVVSTKMLNAAFNAFRMLHNITNPKRTSFISDSEYGWIENVLQDCFTNVHVPNYKMDPCNEEVLKANRSVLCLGYMEIQGRNRSTACYQTNVEMMDPVLDVVWLMFESVKASCFNYFQGNTRLFHRYAAAIMDLYSRPMKLRWALQREEKEFWHRVLGPGTDLGLRNIDKCAHFLLKSSKFDFRTPRFFHTNSVRLSHTKTEFLEPTQASTM